MRRAAIYARISSDDGSRLWGDPPAGGLGVAGWRLSRGGEVAEEYVDNDVSAFSGKPRPWAYERMMADMVMFGLQDAGGDRLRLIVWTRRPIELGDGSWSRMGAAGGGSGAVRGEIGDLDVANGDGLLLLRLLGMVAARTSRRPRADGVKRSMLEIAEGGRVARTVGPARPFGYDDDRIHRPDEAEIIRGRWWPATLAGESLGRWRCGSTTRACRRSRDGRGCPPRCEGCLRWGASPGCGSTTGRSW